MKKDKIDVEEIFNPFWEVENYIWALADEDINEEEAILGIKYIIQKEVEK